MLFGTEIETCVRCGGNLKIIASIEEPQVIARLRERTGEICRGLPPENEGRRNCERLLKLEAKETVGA